MIHLTVRKHETKSKAIKIYVHSQRDIRGIYNFVELLQHIDMTLDVYN